jgi:hypothetical protein
MSHDVKLTSGKGDMAKRIADRLRPSNDHGTADHHHVAGSGPTRTSTTIHHGGDVKAHGPLGEGEGGSQ